MRCALTRAKLVSAEARTDVNNFTRSHTVSASRVRAALLRRRPLHSRALDYAGVCACIMWPMWRATGTGATKQAVKKKQGQENKLGNNLHCRWTVTSDVVTKSEQNRRNNFQRVHTHTHTHTHKHTNLVATSCLQTLSFQSFTALLLSTSTRDLCGVDPLEVSNHGLSKPPRRPREYTTPKLRGFF